MLAISLLESEKVMDSGQDDSYDEGDVDYEPNDLDIPAVFYLDSDALKSALAKMYGLTDAQTDSKEDTAATLKSLEEKPESM